MSVAAQTHETSSAVPADRSAPPATLASAHIRLIRAKAIPAAARKPGDITDLLAAMPYRPEISAGLPLPAAMADSSSPVADTAEPEAAGAGASEGAGEAVRASSPAPVARLRLVDPTAVPSPPDTDPRRSVPIQPAPQRPRERGRRNPDIFGYWNRLREGRPFPGWDEMSAREIASYWPNSFILSCDFDQGTPRNGPIISRAVRVAGESDHDQPAGEIRFTQPMIEWILSVGREVAQFGQPVRDSEKFGTVAGPVEYHVVAMPLGDLPPRIDRILCHVSRG